MDSIEENARDRRVNLVKVVYLLESGKRALKMGLLLVSI